MTLLGDVKNNLPLFIPYRTFPSLFCLWENLSQPFTFLFHFPSSLDPIHRIISQPFVRRELESDRGTPNESALQQIPCQRPRRLTTFSFLFYLALFSTFFKEISNQAVDIYEFMERLKLRKCIEYAVYEKYRRSEI